MDKSEVSNELSKHNETNAKTPLVLEPRNRESTSRLSNAGLYANICASKGWVDFSPIKAVSDAPALITDISDTMLNSSGIADLDDSIRLETPKKQAPKRQSFSPETKSPRYTNTKDDPLDPFGFGAAEMDLKNQLTMIKSPDTSKKQITDVFTDGTDKEISISPDRSSKGSSARLQKTENGNDKSLRKQSDESDENSVSSTSYSQFSPNFDLDSPSKRQKRTTGTQSNADNSVNHPGMTTITEIDWLEADDIGAYLPQRTKAAKTPSRTRNSRPEATKTNTKEPAPNKVPTRSNKSQKRTASTKPRTRKSQQTTATTTYDYFKDIDDFEIPEEYVI